MLHKNYFSLIGYKLILQHFSAYFIAESFPRCRRSDPDLNSCLHAAIEKATQELKNGWYY
jgi:hypothetical protein